VSARPEYIGDNSDMFDERSDAHACAVRLDMPGSRVYSVGVRSAVITMGVVAAVGFSGPMLAVGARAGRLSVASVCPQKPPTLVGTPGDDMLVGTRGADVIGRGASIGCLLPRDDRQSQAETRGG
jgi:hypothetical protein